MLVGQLALLAAALFSGAAFCITAVERAARLGLDHRSLLMEWKPAYKRGTAMQAPLALAGFALGLAASFGAENRVHLSARCASVTAASLRSSASSEAVLRPAWTIVRFPEFHSLERTM